MNTLQKLYRKDRHITRLLIMMVVWMVFMAITKFDKFYAIANFQTIAGKFPELRSRAAGGAEISGLVIAEVLLFAACIGFLAGSLNGILISKIHIPPILATLGVNQLLTGIALVVTNGKAVSDIPMAFSSTINPTLLKVVPGKRGTVTGLIPVQLLFFIAAAVFVWFLLSRTSYGKKLYLTGTSEKVARFSGLKVDRLLIFPRRHDHAGQLHFRPL